jgi:DnaJ-class molecular chaperone
MITKAASLKPGELICNKCSGGGSYPQKFLEKEDPAYNHCPKCNGKGTLDWIENIMGVQGTYIKPGVYVREVDVSVLIKPGEKYEVLGGSYH